MNTILAIAVILVLLIGPSAAALAFVAGTEFAEWFHERKNTRSEDMQ
jgi:hypothetical protein